VKDHHLAGKTSRRCFARTVAATLAVAPLAPRMVCGQTPNPAEQGGAARPSPPHPAESYAEVARAMFGNRFTAEEFARLRRELESNVRASSALSAVKLRNSDEPDFIWSA
jgi:hypothetical protein